MIVKLIASGVHSFSQKRKRKQGQEQKEKEEENAEISPDKLLEGKIPRIPNAVPRTRSYAFFFFAVPRFSYTFHA
jgi:hypothetical protein